MSRPEEGQRRPRPSAWSRWRVDLRLARRQIARTKGSSLLVMLLVALPVIALAAAAVFTASHIPSAAQRATLELGRAQAWIEIIGGPDPSRTQAIDQPNYSRTDVDENGGAPINPELPRPENADAVIPAGTRVITLHRYGSAYVTTATGTAHMPASVGPVWDPALAGRYTIVDGRVPASGHEAMVTPGALQRIGARIGGALTLPDQGLSFTITGTMRAMDQDPAEDQVFLPASAAGAVQTGGTTWYTVDWQPDYQTLQEMNHAGFVAFARDLVLDPPAGAYTEVQGDRAMFWQLVLYGAIAAAFCGYLVVLLAGAAFAVAARRQQRALAVAASVGAARSDIFRIVVLQGTVLGALGGLFGGAIGIAASAVWMLVTDNGVVGSFWGNWGIQVPWTLIAGIIAFAVIVGTIAAIAPARGATRGDVLAALRGSRRPARLNPRRPLWGLGMMLLGLCATVGGALGTAALNAAPVVNYDTPWRAVLIIAIVAGPVVFQIGFIVGGHWLLARIAAALSHVGLAARIAARDAAATPSRVVPAFASIAACVFLASFALSATAMTNAGSSRNYAWGGHLGLVQVFMWGDDIATHPDEYVDAARSLVASTNPQRTGVLSGPVQYQYDPSTRQPADPAAPAWSVADASMSAGDCDRCDPRAALTQGPSLAVAEPQTLAAYLGRPLPAAARAVLQDGGALALADHLLGPDGDSVTLTRWSAATYEEYNNALARYWQGSTDAADLPTPEATQKIPATTLAGVRFQGGIQLVITPETAAHLGIRTQPQTLMVAYAEPPTPEVTDALTAAAAGAHVGRGGFDVYVEKGPAPIDPVLWAISGGAMALVLGAGAVCLGLARFERRPDDATLSAVGAGIRVRRRINAWQALIIVGIGTIVGTAAGLIPMWGIGQTSSDYLQFADAPWLWLGLLAFGLPVVTALVSWCVRPRMPDLTRRVAIA
ncbi:hypothetical protein GCM10022240_20570 [Microbacterium kribbense]|uniref:ABC3 transporter permease C-terminal domain-containing protein n=1 Tax=Microbacterium kribbense TaxID=433645 RepID=A0ABP7GQZ3_9MICO